MAADVTVAALAFLWDHQVGGRALLAAAAALEMAVAGSRALLADRADNVLALQGASFDRPLALPQRQSGCCTLMTFMPVVHWLVCAKAGCMRAGRP